MRCHTAFSRPWLEINERGKAFEEKLIAPWKIRKLFIQNRSQEAADIWLGEIKVTDDGAKYGKRDRMKKWRARQREQRLKFSRANRLHRFELCC